MHGSRLSSWYTVSASTVALAIAIGGGALAIGASSTAPIRACAAKRTHTLTLAGKHGACPRGAARVTWNQRGIAGAAGATGARGATGATGPTGSPGPTGTVDTSQFYDKTTSDGRFLALHGTADQARNADALGDRSLDTFTATDNSLTSREPGTNFDSAYDDVLPAGEDDVVYPVGTQFLGTLTATCADPATTTGLHYAFAAGHTGSIQILNSNTSTDTYSDSVASANVSLANAGHVTLVVDYGAGQVSWIDVYTDAGPGGRNECRVRTFYDRFVPSP